MSELPSVTLPEFQPWPKISRWQREWIITEKLDGTNACVHVSDDMSVVLAGSRNRWLSPAIEGVGKSKSNDNYGFASWVKQHEGELKALGPGYHYGEWWGKGIARGYDCAIKCFSLFNTSRWSDETLRPKCCHVVPVLEHVSANASVHDAVNYCMAGLRQNGSKASPGFGNPEGIVIFHVPSKTMFKKTLQHDEKRKEEVTP